MCKPKLHLEVDPIDILTILLTVLLVSLILLTVAPLRKAISETNVEERKQAALTFLSEVAGVDTSVYTIELSYTYTDEQPVREWSFTIYLTNRDESVRALLYFECGIVSCFKVYDAYALSAARQSKPILDIAREIVQPLYADVLEGPNFAADCTALIDLALPDRNQSLMRGNLLLETEEDGRLLLWNLFANDLFAYSPLYLSFSDEGHLMRLGNGWGIYSISSLPIKVTEEAAKSIALDYAFSYAQENGRVITSTTAQLRYDLTDDRYTFRPTWCVEVSFEPTASNIFGYSLLLLADTKAVLSLGPLGNIGSGAKLDFTLSHLMSTGAILGVAGLYVFLRKRPTERHYGNH